MGSGIARNIQKSGCRLNVYNRTAEKAQPLVAAGPKLARTPCEAAAGAEFVITNLMDDASVLGAQVKVPLPYASMVRDKILAAQARGMGQLDWSCLTEIAPLNAGQA